MPSVSVAQRKLIGMALHHPEEVSGKNRSILSMKRSDMEDFAKTSEKGLPEHAPKKKRQFAFPRYRK